MQRFISPLIANRENQQSRRPVSELPPRFRSIFPFVSFNHVQSLVFESLLQSDRPIVISAPTGSGKTGVFELAIVKMIMDCEQHVNMNLGPAKIVYLAPTKALCTERRIDWERKFTPFNIQCQELTSDVNLSINLKNLTKSTILLATPEKWDSITRSCMGQKAFLQSVRLLLIDEIHLVNDGARGATLEAVISRMKTIRSQIWPTQQEMLRFIGVSATVSNVKDIAEWFSTPEAIAEVHQVSPQERPVKLRTIVLGYSTGKQSNEFSFDHQLNQKLPDVIKEHSHGKPTLIFCATRRSAQIAASSLAKSGGFDACYSSDKRKGYLQISEKIRDTKLQETTRFGIAFHHAGLAAGDRRVVESGFIDGRIMILCCTSTLALGVNLPAHLVIIKNTTHFDEGQFKPYSESSLVQMIGRAGRPQFDTEATAVIMTKISCREEIEKMLTGRLIVDSQLHKFLTEHINSEIVLGTITNDIVARQYINSTFLNVRIRKNPENYGLKKGCPLIDVETCIIKWCRNSIEMLLKYSIATRTNTGQLEPTDAGRAMARHYVCLDTMVKLINLKGTENLWDLIVMICSCHEISSDVQLRTEDKPTLNALMNPSNEKQKLKFSVGTSITTRELKAAVLIQAALGNIPITEISIYQESNRIMRNATRVVNCLREVTLLSNSIGFNLVVNIVTLSQCFRAKLWNDTIYVSNQLEKIGPILSHNLANNGLTTFEALRKANPRNIEIFCNRLPPFGSGIQQTSLGLPIYGIKLHFRKIPNVNDKIQLMVEITITNGQDLRIKQSLPSHHSCTLLVGCPKTDKLLFKHQIVDAAILHRPDLTVCYGADIDSIDFPPDQEEIVAHLKSDIFVGLDVEETVIYREPDDDLF